jgi:preprotein translocase subunit YajC
MSEGLSGQLPFLLLMLVVFFFFIILPQQRRQKKRKEFYARYEKGRSDNHEKRNPWKNYGIK